MTYEEMLCYAHDKNIEVVEIDFNGSAKGYQIENVIFINKKLTSQDKRCTLSEELSHCIYKGGNILNLDDIRNKKAELLARNNSYCKLIKMNDFIKAFEEGIRNRYELAEFLNVTEEFLDDAIVYYCQKYSNQYFLNNYMITFSPLGILKVY
ncbi:MAG: ImmA/IrrE family metallo-endopeptidase [Clostridium sp.]